MVENITDVKNNKVIIGRFTDHNDGRGKSKL